MLSRNIKNTIFRATLLFTAFVISLARLHAQTPVQLLPQLLPPYSLQASDYYSGTLPKLQVLLLNRDIALPSITVRLRMTIEGQNCRMRTKDNFRRHVPSGRRGWGN